MQPPDALNRELVRRYSIWMVAQHYASGTQSYYRRILRDYCEFLDKKPIVRATHLDIVAFLARESARGITLQGVHHQLNILRMFYDFLNLGGLIDYVPPRFVRLRPATRLLPKSLSEDAVRKLIAAAKSPRDRALIELLYATGCRIGEASEIRVDSIDFSARTIRVHGKGKSRIVLFGPQADQAIRAYLGNRRDGFLFACDWRRQWGSVVRRGNSWIGTWIDYDPTATGCRKKQRFLGRVASMSRLDARAKLRRLLRHEHVRRPERDKPVCPQTLLESVQNTARRAGLGSVTPRMLRHSFATHLLDHGADIRVIQRLLGHAWLQTTQIYTNLSNTRVGRTFDQCHPRGAGSDDASKKYWQKTKRSGVRLV